MDQPFDSEAFGAALPQVPEALTPAWLTNALSRTVPGVTVTDVDVAASSEATNHHATLVLAHDGGARLPSTVFLKIPPIDPVRRKRLDWESMGRRETRFYRDLAPTLEFRVPEVFVAELDDRTDEFVLVMEDLTAGGCVLPSGTVGVSPDLISRALVELAGLHVVFEDRAVRASRAAWIQPSGRAGDYGARLLREGLDVRRDELAPAFVDVAERYIAGRDQLQDAWELGPMTLLHGDAHLGNIFIDGDRLGFYDWGLMTLGSPMRDVTYLMTMAMSPTDRAAHEADLIRAYLDARRLLGGAEFSFDEAWWWHRLQAAYAVVASCQAIVTPAGASPNRRAFAAAFVARAEAAVTELESAAALAEHAAG